MPKAKKVTKPEVDEAQIAAWLESTPDFFVRHPALLAKLDIPMETGAAISLHQYQVRILRDDKFELLQKLAALVKNAKTNHKIHSDLLALAGEMISIARQDAALDEYLEKMQKSFSLFAVKYVDKNKNKADFKRVKTALGKQEILCENSADSELLKALFEADAPAVLSAAIMPIMVEKQCVAYCVLAADDAERFTPGMGTDFLKLLANLVSATQDTTIG